MKYLKILTKYLKILTKYWMNLSYVAVPSYKQYMDVHTVSCYMGIGLVAAFKKGQREVVLIYSCTARRHRDQRLHQGFPIAPPWHATPTATYALFIHVTTISGLAVRQSLLQERRWLALTKGGSSD
jgi:hypothetical protein